MVVSARRLGNRLLGSFVSCLLALLLALLAVRLYRPPSMLASVERSPWLEADVLCSLASSGLALAVGLWSRAQERPQSLPFRALLLRALLWFGLTLVLFVVWGPRVFLSTLLIAPTHAFAALRLADLWRRWRVEVGFRA